MNPREDWRPRTYEEQEDEYLLSLYEVFKAENAPNALSLTALAAGVSTLRITEALRRAKLHRRSCIAC